MATMADVAKLAGVSLSTVSYALSGERPVSAETVAKVHEAMDELNYQPNALARGLAGNRTGILAVLLPADETRADPFMADIIIGAADEARDRGYNLLLWREPASDSVALRDLMRQGLVDGALVLSVRLRDERVQTLAGPEGIPFVLIGRTDRSEQYDFVDTDAEQAAAVLLSHLEELGHTSVAYLSPQPDELEGGYGVEARFIEALAASAAASGVAVTPVLAARQVDTLAEALQRALEHDDTITSVVALTDTALAAAYTAAGRSAVGVPERLSIIGLAVPKEVAELTWPPSTTVGPDPKHLGITAVGMLLDRLNQPESAVSHKLVASDLVIRSSTNSEAESST